jgi:hypothetical protein
MLQREYDLPIIAGINKMLYDLCQPPNIIWLEEAGAGCYVGKSNLMPGTPFIEIWSPAEKLDQAIALAKKHSYGLTLEMASGSLPECFISSKTTFPSATRKGDDPAHAVCEALIVIMTGKDSNVGNV